MNLHEYQAKQLLAEYGIAVPPGEVARTADEAVTKAQKLGGDAWVIKAQVHAGGRGKGGGVKVVNGRDELHSAAMSMLGSQLITHQTGPGGLPVNCVLIEPASDLAREMYLGLLVDRSKRKVVILISAAGGVNVEDSAGEAAMNVLEVDPVAGFQAYQGRNAGFRLGLNASQVSALCKLMAGLYRVFIEKDLSLLEINPLAITAEGELLVVDTKIVLDDNALYRHQDLSVLQDVTQEDEKEHAANQHGLNYITLDGNIACMVNGAGLAMATMDIIKLHGGDPANFLDVGGGTTAERVAEAFKLILSDSKVKAILVNIFGGIVRCDLIAEGILSALEQVSINVPVVVRLEGTNALRGRELLESSTLNVITAEGLTDAAQKVVAAASLGGQG